VSSVTRVDVDEAQRLQRDGALFVDVLPSSIYEQEHLPGAISLPLEQLHGAAVEDLNRAKALVVYCFDQH
jgi:rhodanese-related sulfurtransferase